MLMEPDEYTSQERALTDKAKELIEQHELDWGNGECFIQRDAGHSELYMTLEAPNHATVTVTVPAEADEKGLRRAMADGLLDFDPDEEFDECWSREFACFASMFVRQVRQCFSVVWADGFPRCRHRFPVM